MFAHFSLESINIFVPVLLRIDGAMTHLATAGEAMLISAPVLTHPDTRKQFLVDTLKHHWSLKCTPSALGL